MQRSTRPRNASPGLSSTMAAAPTQPEEVHLALDLGSEFAKGATFRKHSFETLAGLDSFKFWKRYENITWSNNKTTMPTEVAYIVDASMSPPGLYPQYGRDLARALERGEIQEVDVIRHYKPVLFGKTLGDEGKTRRQISNVSRKLQTCRRHQGLPEGPPLEVKDLVEHLVGYTFKYTLRCVAEAHRDLGWPVYRDLDDYEGDDWNPRQVKIQVALALPVNTSPEHITLIKEIARIAGLPDVYICGEPAAALMYHLAREPDQLVSDQSFMIMDIGAGSADFAAWKVLQVNPLQVKEIAAPQSKWCGACVVNIMGRNLLLSMIEDEKYAILTSLKMVDAQMDWETLGDRIEISLETVKKDFRGDRSDDEGYVMHIPGLPNMPGKSMPRGGRLLVPVELMREAHKFQLDTITKMVNDALKQTSSRNSRHGQSSGRPSLLLMAGGGSNNVYIRNEMRERFEKAGISVAQTSAERSENTVALGSLLLLANKELVTERIVRRAYCVGRWEEVLPKDRRSYPPNSRTRSKQDGVQRAHMTRFFYRIGDSVPRQHVASLKGWRGLLKDELDGDGGCMIEERLFYTDTVGEDQDRRWLERPGIDIHETPHSLEWRLLGHQVRNFDVEVDEWTGEEYYYLDYEVAVILKDDEMTFQITIPRKGRWLDGLNPYGDDPIRQEGKFDCSGAFKLIHAVT